MESRRERERETEKMEQDSEGGKRGSVDVKQTKRGADEKYD